PSALLPGGANLDPNTGVFLWTPGFSRHGTYTVPFTVSDGSRAVTRTATITVTNVNAAPVFDSLDPWRTSEGQAVSFRAFASDPDNPGFVPQDRTPGGGLTALEGSNPSVTYAASDLPPGAAFDPVTAAFSWTPGFAAAGQ